MNETDFKYLGHDWNKEIEEFEEMSNPFFMINRYDKDKNILISQVSFVPFQVLISELFVLLFLVLTVFIYIKYKVILDYININSIPNFKKIYLFIPFIIALIWRVIVRIYITKKLNKVIIDFNNKNLIIKNIDYIGRYLFEDININFSDIYKFYIKSINDSNLYFQKRVIKIFQLETNEGKIIPLLLLKMKGWNKIKDKRFIDLLTYILKL
ncbi:hypothetical protein ACE01N_19555 [Saccharicrinis sp. FJH2]|uniref:hypothetical protein n=1 Tax=Saccharicrinis sp. FJH65 TaxID=3344659 RepID=UPI0035F354C3